MTVTRDGFGLALRLLARPVLALALGVTCAPGSIAHHSSAVNSAVGRAAVDPGPAQLGEQGLVLF
ncbi:MAG: hypothetical protein ACJ74Q_06190 [Pyrinomonadaceae bacterium]